MAAEAFPCPKCSQLNTTNRRTCKKCGTVLQEYNCPECKKPIRPGEVYCSNCYPHGETKTRGLREEIRDLRAEIRDLGDGILGLPDKALGVWDKIKNKNKSITVERKWATLAKGDTQAKVASIVGKPDSVENEGEDSSQEIWIFECGSGSKRSITFNDGFMVKIEIKY